MSTSSTPRNARLEARITAEQKKLIERAAGYAGRSVSDFVVTTFQEAAKAVVREHELLRLNRLQSQAFVEALLNAPKPKPALRQAAGEYRQNVDSK